MQLPNLWGYNLAFTVFRHVQHESRSQKTVGCIGISLGQPYRKLIYHFANLTVISSLLKKFYRKEEV